MQVNFFYKCNICGSICNLKYQLGFSKKHPIRYKCSCGITIKGTYQENLGISFENATSINECMPNFVVHSSGEFLTPTLYEVVKPEDIIRSTSFINALQSMDYEKFRKILEYVINYRDYQNSIVHAINELYEAKNFTILEKIIRQNYDSDGNVFPLNNQADYLRAVTMINQFQFLPYNNVTSKVTNNFLQAFRKSSTECSKFLNCISSLNRLNEWKRKLHQICTQIYEKIDLLIPVIGIEFYHNKALAFNSDLSITTTSFEEIKQLYVDLYELISSLLFLPIGFDNILLRDNFESMNTVPGINITILSEVLKMRNKGNIIKLIDKSAPLESLLCECLDSHIRNGIGHFSYKSKEIANRHGQIIRFYSINNSDDYVDFSLIEICYDIWNMYKSLGIFNELIHLVEIQLLAKEKHIYPSFVTDSSVKPKLINPHFNTKVYPNDLCPCGSGLKYKKCCKKILYSIF